ncbi:MAG: hypothetical protein JO107_16895 [Hyphomicrobiales bacterium]|nr:hypothetical protein [Hyphomicrobiales bacterium]MBV8664766.1 hypothetical protein [Hyphomicrobiales bacterium]
MTRTPVRRRAPVPARVRRLAALAGVVFAAALVACATKAAPLTLGDDAAIASLAGRLRAYAGASRVKWVVAARTQSEADAAIAALAAHLGQADRYLLARVKAQPLGEAAPDLAGSNVPLAWIAPQFAASPGAPACSWQVWVSDPSLPSVGDSPLAVPLTPNDRLPVGAAATFRVGHSGLLQSKLYAFDETSPGAIRDLARVPDADIPVATEPEGETIFLAMARETAPFLESLKSALASSEGRRLDLGKDYALRGKLLGQGRGIGANIQIVPPGMIAPKVKATATLEAKQSQLDSGGPLMETCLFALTPKP